MYAKEHNLYIFSGDSDFLFLSVKSKGMLYYRHETKVNELRKTIHEDQLYHQSIENVLEQISLEDLMFICFLVGNDQMRGICGSVSKAADFYFKKGREACIKEYQRRMKISEEEVESRFKEFCDDYAVPEKMKSFPRSLLYDLEDNTPVAKFDIKSSYNFSRFLHLLYSWTYKSPILIYPEQESI